MFHLNVKNWKNSHDTNTNDCPHEAWSDGRKLTDFAKVLRDSPQSYLQGAIFI